VLQEASIERHHGKTIEQAWSKLKEGLRQLSPRTFEALDNALPSALATITATESAVK